MICIRKMTVSGVGEAGRAAGDKSKFRFLSDKDLSHMYNLKIIHSI